MPSLAAQAAVLAGALLTFVLIRALVQLFGRRADSTRDVIRKRVQNFFEG